VEWVTSIKITLLDDWRVFVTGMSMQTILYALI